MEKITNKERPQVIIQKKKNKIKKFLILISAFLLFNLFVFGSFYFSIKDNKPGLKGFGLGSKINALSPTPFPFEEMTIPYLRSKTYESKLNLLEKISENNKYISYIASYDSDGFKINGSLTIPNVSEENKPIGGFPAIVFVHGYITPTLYSTTGEAYSAYIDYLARSGFVVFKIDLRGHGNSEGVAGGGYFGSDYVTDALNARSALLNSGLVNNNNIGFWGHSMAGNIVLRSLVVRPDIPAAVIWAGAVYSYTDQRKYGISDNSYRPLQTTAHALNTRGQLYKKYGSPSATSVFWQQVAPTNFLNDLTGAIEIHHAVDDNVVNIGYSRDLMKILDKTKVPHKLYEYESGGHNISGESFDLAMERTVKFFKEKLKRY